MKLDYTELCNHIEHDVRISSYGKSMDNPDNVALECDTCGEVLLDFDRMNEVEELVNEVINDPETQ